MDELPPLFGPGQHLGRYELLQRLAVGGMAEVYLAYAVGPGDFRKVVAIKRLLPQHALDPQLMRMFLDEARLMARLSHPNIPQVTDVDDGQRSGTVEVPYFVMEYVHGTDLRGVLNAAAGPLPIEHALAITMAVAAGLHHAHEHRGAAGQRLEIVHRDVSPSNILISFDGGVKVTDFGVAKWTEQKSFTHQGQLKGKFAHMSPEQCRGEVLDRRSDVFALGTLLYEMTTGDPPFMAESEYELLTQIVSRAAPPPVRPGEPYPADLAAIVMRSLGRAREERYESAQHFQLALEAFAREHRLVVSPVALAEYLESLFGARVTEWREAQASGRTLADHLARPEGRPTNAGGGASPQARSNNRTATDVFARVPPLATPKAPLPENRSDGKPGMTRALAFAGVAALALALLLVATELTSRWQRDSRPTVSPVRRLDPGAPAPAPPPPPSIETATTTTAAPGTSPDPPSGSPSSTPAPRPSPPPSPTRAIPTSPAAERRGREAVVAGRPSPPEARPGTAVASTSTGSDSAPAVAPPPPAEPQVPPSGAPPAAADRPPASASPSPPPTPVKVWDPDSPVPP